MTAVSDDFNRANSTSLGASWTEVVGNWEIVSNKVQCNDDDGGTGYYARYETDVGSSDMFCQAVTTSTQVDASSNTGLAVRMRSAANTSYQMTTRHAGDTIGVWRIVAGAESQQSWQTEAQSISVTINSGDTIRVEAAGSLVRGKVAGALVGICVDTNITDGQRAGLNGYNNVGTDVVELDDFAGGGLIADGGLLAPIIVGISAQVTGTGTTLTPTIPANIASGDLVIVQTTCRDAAQTMGAPGGEGWASQQNPSQTGLEDVAWAKVWGLGGQTDDTTPTFTIGSGTAGWGATAIIIRNPSHSTAPWTSVASAVVASGSGANASSATVTAPSVNHDGTHRTVVRLFSSADDNALNAPSSGALAYGGAAYDSTTGNDFSQAMSLREDITVTTNTGTSTVTETVLGNDINNGITLVLAIPSSATNVNAANASGSGEAGGVDASIAVNAGLSSAAGSAPTATPNVAPNAGTADGSGSALGATTTITASLGAATGAGSAPQATAFVAVFAGLASGAGTALAATATGVAVTAANADPASGDGTSLAASPSIATVSGVAAGAGTAQPASTSVAATAGLASATGTASGATASTAAFTNASASAATGAGAAHTAGPSVSPSAGLPSAGGTGNAATPAVAATAGLGSGSGSANQATVQTSSFVDALAGLAAGSGTAHQATVALAVLAALAAATGLAYPVAMGQPVSLDNGRLTITASRLARR